MKKNDPLSNLASHEPPATSTAGKPLRARAHRLIASKVRLMVRRLVGRPVVPALATMPAEATEKVGQGYS